MFGLGLPEITIILVVIALLFFGGEKLSEIARGLGRFTGEFKKGKEEIEKEIGKAGKELKELKENKETKENKEAKK